MPLLALLPLLAIDSLPGIVAGPYLQLASTPNSVVVQFVQRGNQGIKVTSGNLTVKPAGSLNLATPGLKVVKFIVADVGEKFTYSVTTGGKTATFLGKGSAPANKTKVAIFGDSGRGLPGQSILAKQMNQYDANLIVHVGDIVYPNGRESEYFKFHFPVYGPMLSRVPSVAAAGNHDTAYRDLKKYPDGLAYYKLWHLPQNKPSWAKDLGNFSFTYGNSFWVILDSNTYNGWSQQAPQAWLRNELKKGASAKWRFVAFHHPPFHSSDKKKDEVYMKAIAPILNQAKVNAVFSGHVHNFQRTKPVAGQPIYFVTGAGGAELYDQKLANNPSKWKPFTAVYLPGYSFTTLEFDSKTAEVKQVDSKGELIDKIILKP